MEFNKTGVAGFVKSTISIFLPMEFAMYNLSVVGSKETISAELVPLAPLEKLVSKFSFSSLFGAGAW
ncbi:hypothetical protein D3C86_1459430 [compost metagenome]